ncbi:MAG: hypothetical protein WBW92_07900, partial [Rhodanobacteraceae bacterium]
PYEYWQTKFARLGYQACDCIRPYLKGQRDVSFWYRYNSVLYVRHDKSDTLSQTIRKHMVPADTPILDTSPAWFRIRKTIVSSLPERTRNQLAKLKSRLLS